MPSSDSPGGGGNIWSGGRGAVFGVSLIALVSFIVYKGSGGGRFVYDDINLIVVNPNIRSLSGLRELVAGGRPIRALSFMMDYFLWGYNPRGYHFTNVILHMACASMFFLYIRRLFRNAALALGAALLFAVHPAGSEAVVAVSHRKEMLALVFMLASLFAYNASSGPPRSDSDNPGQWPRPRVLLYLLSLAFYFTALGSKQVAIVTPLIMWVTDFLVSGRPVESLRRRWLLYIAPILIPMSFFFLKFGDWRAFGAFPAEGLLGPLYVKIILLSGWAVTGYLKLMFWPTHLHIDHFIPVPRLLPFATGAALFCAMIAGAVILRRKPVWSFGLFWIPINIAPVLNIIPANEVFAERYVYIPLAGGCLLIASGLHYCSDRAEAVRVFRTLLFLCLSAMTSLWWMILYWRFSNAGWFFGLMVCAGALLLWGTMRVLSGRRYLGSAPVRIILAVAVVVVLMFGVPRIINRYSSWEMFWSPDQFSKLIGDLGKLFPNQAQGLNPGKMKTIWFNYGTMLNIAGLALIAAYIGGTLKGKKGRGNFATGLMLVLLMFGGLTNHRIMQWRTGARLWSSTLKENPDSVRGAVNLGIAYRRKDNYRRAFTAYSWAVRLDPNNPLSYYNLGLAALRIGKMDYARSAFERTAELDPGYVDAHLNLGNIYVLEQRYAEAAGQYEQVIKLDPKNARAWYNLAVVYGNLGEREKFGYACEKAIELRPDFEKAKKLCEPKAE